MTRRILIAGCGDIGTAVGAALANQGHHVVGLRRSAVPAEANGICYFQADLTRPGTLPNLPVNFDLVLVIVTPSERSEAGYKAIYLQGVGHLLEHFASQGARPPVIYVSSTRVYGQHQGEWVNENSITEPADGYGRILLEAEQQVLAFSGQNDAGTGATNTIVRFSGIYGRGLQFMQKLAVQGKPIQYSPPSFTNRVHRDDCVSVLIFLVHKALAGESLASHYLVSDDDPAPKWDVVAWFADQAGMPQPAQQVLTETLAEKTGQGKRCSNQRIREAGYDFLYPSYRDGYRS